jgi:RimJ/RimL family protein N-acetyltransferase
VAIKLRPIKPEDNKEIYNWANDPDTIQSRFIARPVSIIEHEKWFSASLVNPNRTMYMAEDEKGNKIGIVRIDRLNAWLMEFDINVAPNMRGRGYGTKMILLASEMFGPRKHGLLFLARIKKINPGSKAAFIKAGFTRMFDYIDKDSVEVEVLGKMRI